MVTDTSTNNRLKNV